MKRLTPVFRVMFLAGAAAALSFGACCLAEDSRPEQVCPACDPANSGGWVLREDLPVDFEIDYIRVWQKKATGG